MMEGASYDDRTELPTWFLQIRLYVYLGIGFLLGFAVRSIL